MHFFNFNASHLWCFIIFLLLQRGGRVDRLRMRFCGKFKRDYCIFSRKYSLRIDYSRQVLFLSTILAFSIVFQGLQGASEQIKPAQMVVSFKKPTQSLLSQWTKNLNDLKASPLRLEIQIWQKKSFEKSSHPATHILIAFLLKKSRKEYGDLTKHIFCTLLLKTYLSASWWSKNI